jgi:hypothetical protein
VYTLHYPSATCYTTLVSKKCQRTNPRAALEAGGRPPQITYPCRPHSDGEPSQPVPTSPYQKPTTMETLHVPTNQGGPSGTGDKHCTAMSQQNGSGLDNLTAQAGADGSWPLHDPKPNPGHQQRHLQPTQPTTPHSPAAQPHACRKCAHGQQHRHAPPSFATPHTVGRVNATSGRYGTHSHTRWTGDRQKAEHHWSHWWSELRTPRRARGANRIHAPKSCPPARCPHHHQEIADKHVTATHNLQGLAGTPGLI